MWMCVCVPFVCAHEIRRKRGEGGLAACRGKRLSPTFFFSTRHAKIFDISKLMPITSSLSLLTRVLLYLALFYRRDARTFPHEIEKHRAGAAGFASPARIPDVRNDSSHSHRTFSKFPNWNSFGNISDPRAASNDFASKGAVKPISSRLRESRHLFETWPANWKWMIER